MRAKAGFSFLFINSHRVCSVWIYESLTDILLLWINNPSLHGYFCVSIYHSGRSFWHFFMTGSRGVLNFFLSKVRNMFIPRRGRPGSEGDATPVIAPDIHWAFSFHPSVWVCMFPHMAINVSIFAVLYSSLCAVTFSPLS